MSFLIYPTPKMMPMQGMIGMGGGATSLFSKPPASGSTEGGDYSIYFNGTTSKSFITCADDDAFAAGTGDFSVECWLKAEQYSHYMNFVNTRDAGGTAAGWTFSVESNGTLGFYSNGHTYSAAGSVSDNTWTHVITTRQGTTLRLMQDGVLKSNTTNSQNFSNGLWTIGINCSGDDSSGAAGWYRGYMSQVRYVVGSVPSDYQTSSTTDGTTIFSVPTSPLTTSSEGCTSDDVVFLGCNCASVDDYTVAASEYTVGGHTSNPTDGHDGPF